MGISYEQVDVQNSARHLLNPVQVYEVTFDRLGSFTGVKQAMALKGHKSKVGDTTGTAKQAH
jgi:hypothetical protein